MPELELKTFNPVVFNDPVYCNIDAIQKCKYKSSFGNCVLFPIKIGSFRLLYVDKKAKKWKKHKQCIDHYFKCKYPEPPKPPPKRKICEDVFLKDHYQRNKK